jgi:hypothetical protein
MTTRWARVARGTLAACFAVFVAALFHAAMGGGVPSALAITLALAFAIPACVLLTQGRKTSTGLLRQALAVTLSQFVLHALFSLRPGGAQFGGAQLGGAAGVAAGSAHLHAGSHLAMTSEASASGMAMHETPLMWLGHASAVVLTVVAMRYGERTLRVLLATAAIGIAVSIVAIIERITLVPVRATAAMLRAVDAQPVILPAPRVLIGRMRHRGPPVGAFNDAAPFNCAASFNYA